MRCREGGQGRAAPKLRGMGWGSPQARAFSGEQPNAWAHPLFREQINNRAGRTGHLHCRLWRAGRGQLHGVNGGLTADPWHDTAGGLPHAKAEKTDVAKQAQKG